VDELLVREVHQVVDELQLREIEESAMDAAREVEEEDVLTAAEGMLADNNESSHSSDDDDEIVPTMRVVRSGEHYPAVGSSKALDPTLPHVSSDGQLQDITNADMMRILFEAHRSQQEANKQMYGQIAFAMDAVRTLQESSKRQHEHMIREQAAMRDYQKSALLALQQQEKRTDHMFGILGSVSNQLGLPPPAPFLLEPSPVEEVPPATPTRFLTWVPPELPDEQQGTINDTLSQVLDIQGTTNDTPSQEPAIECSNVPDALVESTESISMPEVTCSGLKATTAEASSPSCPP